jgi:CheY-like chemotaxis protein
MLSFSLTELNLPEARSRSSPKKYHRQSQHSQLSCNKLGEAQIGLADRGELLLQLLQFSHQSTSSREGVFSPRSGDFPSQFPHSPIGSSILIGVCRVFFITSPKELVVATQKILVIDDSKVIRMRVKEMLPGNVEVIEAKDGLQGLNLIRSEHPNLIMLDFLLPKMSGWEVYQEVQKNPELQSIPLVMMSGRKEEVTEKLPEPFEYFAFVGKPFEKKQLLEAIQDATKKARKRPAAAAAPAAARASGDTAAMQAEINALKEQVGKMNAEIEGLKKQLVQLVGFIKQKLK